MRFAVDEDEVEEIRKQTARSRPKRDEEDDNREITLGAGSLLGIFFGMVLICGIFFGLGYSVGRGSVPRIVSQPAVTPGATVAASQQPKPSPDQSSLAVPSDASAAPADTTASGAAQTTPPGTAPAAGTQTTSSQAAATQPAAQPAAQQASTAPISTPAIAPVPLQAKTPAHPAAQPVAMQPTVVTPSMGTYMVQVAAVRLQEDASVLVTALQNRGYKVIVRHTPQDSLLHVQLGPFVTRAQAMAMRARLLADGYNAVIKQ
jgi:cell division septation protein DedD